MNTVHISHQFATVFPPNRSCVNAVVTVTGPRREGLQTDETLLFGPYLGGTDDRRLGWEKPFHGWSRGRVSGAAAAPLVIGLVPRVIDKAVGSGLTAVLDAHSQLCGVQSSVNTIHEHA